MTILCPESVRILASFFVNILPLVRVSWQQSGLAICVDIINPQKPNRRRAFSTILRQIRKSPGPDWQDPPNRHLQRSRLPTPTPSLNYQKQRSRGRTENWNAFVASRRSRKSIFHHPQTRSSVDPPVKITCRLEARLPISDKIPPTKTKTVSLSLVTNDSPPYPTRPFALCSCNRETHTRRKFKLNCSALML